MRLALVGLLAVATAGCGSAITPAQEVAIERGICVVLDEGAVAVGGPAAGSLVTIACDALGAYLLAGVDAGAPAPAPAPVAAVKALKVQRVTRSQCVVAGLCSSAPVVIVDAGAGG